jgi:hypothetical protein
MKRKATGTPLKRRTSLRRIPVTIRLPDTLVAKIDQELDSRAVPVSRNNWLLEAAVEKLGRSESRGSNGAK